MKPRPLSEDWYTAQLRAVRVSLAASERRIQEARTRTALAVDVEGTGHGGREGVYAVDDLPSQRYREE